MTVDGLPDPVDAERCEECREVVKRLSADIDFDNLDDEIWRAPAPMLLGLLAES
jgi:hypothetical protein